MKFTRLLLCLLGLSAWTLPGAAGAAPFSFAGFTAETTSAEAERAGLVRNCAVLAGQSRGSECDAVIPDEGATILRARVGFYDGRFFSLTISYGFGDGNMTASTADRRRIFDTLVNPLREALGRRSCRPGNSRNALFWQEETRRLRDVQRQVFCFDGNMELYIANDPQFAEVTVLAQRDCAAGWDRRADNEPLGPCLPHRRVRERNQRR